jgi:hypothetical protein
VGKFPGVLVVVGIIALTSLVAIRLVSAALAPRPVIKPFPAHYLSRSPIIKWEYRDAQEFERHGLPRFTDSYTGFKTDS